MRYSKEKGPWSFYRIPSAFQSPEHYEEVAKLAKKWRADAIVGRWSDDKMYLLEDLNIPIVLQNYHNRSTVYSNITGDYKGTGVMAAKYFASRHFSNFAFFGIKGVVWSEERLIGYSSEVKKLGGRLFVYEKSTAEERDWGEMVNWLLSLPDHTAVFCCDDERALSVTSQCRAHNIDIPSRVSVLGVDNDDLMCCLSDPTISSIQLGVEQGGYNLCARLHKRILHLDESQFSIVIDPIQVIERGSTAINTADPIVKRLLIRINSDYSSRLSVDGLLEDIPLSRRSIETRFKKETGMGVYQYVMDCRIRKVAQLLVTTKKTLQEIASESGIPDLDSLSKQFRKRMKCTPNEYRHKFCAFSG